MTICPTCAQEFTPAGLRIHQRTCGMRLPISDATAYLIGMLSTFFVSWISFIKWFLPSKFSLQAVIVGPVGAFACFYIHYMLYCYTIGNCGIVYSLHTYGVFVGEVIYLGFRWLGKVYQIVSVNESPSRASLLSAMSEAATSLTSTLTSESLILDPKKLDFTF